MREDKLIRGPSPGNIESALTLAVRRAVGDEKELGRLTEQVAQLCETGKRTRDAALMDTVGRLVGELRAAVSGVALRHQRPILEYKDCALALSSTQTRFAPSRKRGEMQFGGYGSTFNGDSDSYDDIILPGAFRKSLERHKAAGTKVKLFWSHDATQVPGKWLEMYEDAHGLVTEGQLARTTLGNDLNELIALGAVDALSIGFVIPPKGSSYDSNGIRVIREIDLHEVSLVALPANPNARLNTPMADPLGEAMGKLRRVVAEAAKAEGRSATVIDFPKREPTEADVMAALKGLSRRMSRNTR